MIRGFMRIEKTGGDICEFSLLEAPFRDELVTATSVAMFNDHDPCILHRTYAERALSLQLLDILSLTFSDKRTFDDKDIPECLRQMILLPKDLVRVTIW